MGKQKFLVRVGLLWFFSLVFLFYKIWVTKPDDQVHIIFCDVGQGDAVLFNAGNTQVLIDGGPNAAVLDCLSEFMPFWDATIDLVVATHADSDHIAGLNAVLERYKVDTLLVAATNKDTAVFETFKQLALNKKIDGLKILGPYVGQKITIKGCCSFTTLSPNQPPTETPLSAHLAIKEKGLRSENDRSIALLAEVDRVKIFLSGDIEKKTEQALVRDNLTQDVDVLKVPHHGAKTSSTAVFLESLQPEVAVISVGENNRYHHPDSGVLSHLEDIKAKVLRTDKLGDIELVTDGQKYWFE